MTRTPDTPPCPPTWKRNLALTLVALGSLFALDRLTRLAVPSQYRPVPDYCRYHTLYYSLKMARFEQLKPGLKTVILGDSRSRHGVDPSVFVQIPARGGPGSAETVAAFNFAPASGGVEFTRLLMREYLAETTGLQLVVWGTSPRIFNRHWEDPVCDLFRASPGYKHDTLRRQADWTGPGLRAGLALGFDVSMAVMFSSYAHRSILKARAIDACSSRQFGRRFTLEPPIPMNAWGFMAFPRERETDVRAPETIRNYLAALQGGRFVMSAERWQAFREIVAELGARKVRLVCFTPPMHPCLLQSPAADADGTPKAEYAGLVARLKALEGEFPNFSFIDVHAAGAHPFGDAEFADFDHLNPRGAEHLSRLLDGQILAGGLPPAPQAGKSVSGESAPPGRTPATAAETPAPAAGADTTPPTIGGMLGELDYAVRAYPPDNRPVLWAEFHDAGAGIDPAGARFFLDAADVTAKCTITANRISYQPDRTLAAPRLYRFRVRVSDKAGNTAELTWKILLKPC